jgi:hypothetical protein
VRARGHCGVGEIAAAEMHGGFLCWSATTWAKQRANSLDVFGGWVLFSVWSNTGGGSSFWWTSSASRQDRSGAAAEEKNI